MEKIDKCTLIEIDDMDKFEAKIIMGELTNSNNWSNISFLYELPEWFMEKYQNKLDWYLICANQNLSDEFIYRFKDRIDWRALTSTHIFDDKFVEKYLDYFDLDQLIIDQSGYLSKELLEKCKKLNADRSYIKLKRDNSLEIIKICGGDKI